MNLKRSILLALLPVTLCQAESPFYKTGKILNYALGAFYHPIIMLKGLTNNNPVNLELKQLAQTVIKEINCAQHINIYKSTSGPAFCLGNNLYLRDSDLPFYKAHPNALKFVIAHELMHIEKFHTVTHWIANVSLATCSMLISNNIISKFSQNTKNRSFVSRGISDLFWFLGGLALYYSASHLLTPWWRDQETEADAAAISALSPLYGRESISKGAAVFFISYSSLEPYGWYDTLFAEHPSERTRLGALWISPKSSAECFPSNLNKWLTHYIELAALRCRKIQSNTDELEKQVDRAAQSLNENLIIATSDPRAAQIIALFISTWNYRAVIDKNKQLLLDKTVDLDHAAFAHKVKRIMHFIQKNVVPRILSRAQPDPVHHKNATSTAL